MTAHLQTEASPILFIARDDTSPGDSMEFAIGTRIRVVHWSPAEWESIPSAERPGDARPVGPTGKPYAWFAVRGV